MKPIHSMAFETRAIHAGQKPEQLTGAVTVPVYQTSTFTKENIDTHKEFEYSRIGNPTRKALEEVLASLEGGIYGLAFASGAAATTAVFSILKPGDHVVIASDIYGGTYGLLEKVFMRWGLNITYAYGSDPAAFQQAIQRNTKLFWVETPTNPLLKIVGLKALSTIAHQNGILLAVDNTFATSYFQRPLEFGADIVMHSTTKYLSGHSDIIGGAVITSLDTVYHDLKLYQSSAGAVPGPWDCFLTLRGIKTLAIRMREHERNALYLAEFLRGHPSVECVYYPSLASREQVYLAKQQMSGFGGVVSFELKAGISAVNTFFSKVRLFALASSLGSVESLVNYPSSMSHATLSREERVKRGIKDNLIRLSVGIENKDDLKHDLEDALA